MKKIIIFILTVVLVFSTIVVSEAKDGPWFGGTIRTRMEVRQNSSGSFPYLVESYVVVTVYSSLPVQSVKEAAVILKFNDGTELEYPLRPASACYGSIWPWDASEVLKFPETAPPGTAYTYWQAKLDASFSAQPGIVYEFKFDKGGKKHRYPLNDVSWLTWVQPPHKVDVWAEAGGWNCPRHVGFSCLSNGDIDLDHWHLMIGDNNGCPIVDLPPNQIWGGGPGNPPPQGKLRVYWSVDPSDPAFAGRINFCQGNRIRYSIIHRVKDEAIETNALDLTSASGDGYFGGDVIMGPWIFGWGN